MARKTNYEKNGQDYYRVTKTLGIDNLGRPIKKEFYGASKKEAEAKRDEFMRDYEKGLNDQRNAKLGPVIHTWLFEVVRVSKDIKPASFERYEGIYRNYIKGSDIENLVLRTLKSLPIQRHYNKLHNDGKSESQISNLNKLLKKFFFYAVDEGYLEKNPCSGKRVVIPGEAKIKEQIPEFKVFSDEELKIFQKSIIGHQYEALFLFALGTGLRRGELIALREEEVYLKKCLVKIDETARYGPVFNADGTKEYKLNIGTPKNNTARWFPFPKKLLHKLKEYGRLKTEQELKAYPGTYKDEGFFFCNQFGGPVDGRTLYRSYKRVLKAAGLPDRNFHALRHTYATKLLDKDVPLKTIQSLLGHLDLKTTNIYAQVMPEKRAEAVGRINDLFL